MTEIPYHTPKSISISMAREAQTCWWKLFLHYCTDLEKKTDYPRLFGSAMHQHAQGFYRKTAEPRPFYYKTLKSAIGGWFGKWERTLDETYKKGILIKVDPEKEKDYAELGALCTKNFWNGSIKRPRPLQLEREYRVRIPELDYIQLTGKFDQLVEVPIDYIQARRPELVENGQLIPGYDPVAIVDIKTDRYDYDLSPHEKNPTPQDFYRRQFPFHNDLQKTAYSYLYEKNNRGHRNIGFIRWNLRHNIRRFSFSEEPDYQNMFLIFRDIINHFQDQNFYREYGRHCEWCDYLEPCAQDRYLLIAAADDPVIDQTEATTSLVLPVIRGVPTGVEVSPVQQLRFPSRKFKTPRAKGKPKSISSPDKKIILRYLPEDAEPPNLS